MPHSHRERNRQLHSSTLPLYLNSIIGLLQTGSHPVMVGDMSRVTLNFDLSKILLLWISSQDQDLHSHQKHAHLLVLIWERLQMPTSTTTPDATVQPLGWHIANKLSLSIEKTCSSVFNNRGTSSLGSNVLWLTVTWSGKHCTYRSLYSKLLRFTSIFINCAVVSVLMYWRCYILLLCIHNYSTE